MNTEERENRKYETSPLPTLTPQANPDVLKWLYEECGKTWRHLVDVRFKLLGIVPTVSLLLIGTILSDAGPGKGLSITQKLFLAVLGLAVCVGLSIYDRRNSFLHDDLISRARKIESEWGVDTGIFLGRLKPESNFFRHKTATALIYSASILGWSGAICWLFWELIQP
jgi:hypothetical protein